MADIATLRAHKRFARMDYERQLASGGAQPILGIEAAGPPTWSRAAWDAFHAQYGRYPFSASELPPNFEGAPDWVYTLMNMRKPPVQTNASPMSSTPDLAVFRMK